ncbi:DNA alkylation repair protein [Hydrogenophaga crocea]|uniref:DNA alkylation repair protein n=1 Tax=Hydrogenophaga crocea TaxID=2716225 RepID=A0A6G8ILZ1_9BURK|nr:DNA alkylation repair protein [Hydrogenophaga crocea]QIM54046.1 DNA alkylation repair protein [Hydrogenophaga crocea]
MAEPFKNLINPATARHAALHLRRHWRGFDAPRFEALVSEGLDALEFKARALRWADALQATLPDDFDRACGLIEAALAPPLAIDADGEPVGLQGALHPEGIAGWALWGTGEWVARQGQAQPERALQCLHAITQRFTGEFAIRPFIHQQPEAVWPVLQRWTRDPSAHVRRLASEGSRPRLPWGLRLQALVIDPSPTLPLLRALQDDPSAYVRRSVANHLNDIAKDHPGLVAEWVREHRARAGAQREALLRHASRGLIKAGHAPTLAAWGLSQGLQGEATLAIAPARVAVGGAVALQATLRSNARAPQTLVVDYAVHHVKANGASAPKVFKGWKLELAPGEVRALQKSHSLREVTTRRLYPGRHAVDLLVNGVAVASAAFELTA